MAVPLLLFGHCKLVHASRCPWLHLSSLRPHARLRSVSISQRHCCQSPQTSAACQAGVLCLLHACRAPPPGFLHLPSIAEVVLLQTVGVGLKLRLAQRPSKQLQRTGPCQLCRICCTLSPLAAHSAACHRPASTCKPAALHWRAAPPTISCLEISAVACLVLQGASTCLADLRDLLHTQHLASAGGSVLPAALRRTPCKPSGAKRLRAQCEVRQVPRGQPCWLSCMDRS